MFHVPIILQYFVLQTAGVEHQTWVNTTSSSSTSWSLIKRKIVEPLYLPSLTTVYYPAWCWDKPESILIFHLLDLYSRERESNPCTLPCSPPVCYPTWCWEKPRRILIHHHPELYSKGRESNPCTLPCSPNSGLPYLVLAQAKANPHPSTILLNITQKEESRTPAPYHVPPTMC